jgi:hypothetical protein
MTRRMYPLVPPPADVAGEVNLDLAHHELLQLDVAPDVLILPSRLKYFAKVRPLFLAFPAFFRQPLTTCTRLTDCGFRSGHEPRVPDKG